MKGDRYEITTDGITVWVNDLEKNIGRFGRMGIDIHQATIQKASQDGECLFCTHAVTTKEDWDTFVLKMKEFHDVEVASNFMPVRFKTPSRRSKQTPRRTEGVGRTRV